MENAAHICKTCKKTIAGTIGIPEGGCVGLRTCWHSLKVDGCFCSQLCTRLAENPIQPTSLVFSWKTKTGWKDRPVTFEQAFKVKAPLCPQCQVRSRADVASFADRYEPSAVYDDPHAGTPTWSGEFYCPKCRKMVGVVHYPTVKKQEEKVNG